MSRQITYTHASDPPSPYHHRYYCTPQSMLALCLHGSKNLRPQGQLRAILSVSFPVRALSQRVK